MVAEQARWLQIANAADARSYWGAIMPDVVANHDAEVLSLSRCSQLPVADWKTSWRQSIEMMNCL